MSPSATLATESEGQCHQAPAMQSDVRCHAKRRSMSPSTTAGRQKAAATTGPNGTQARDRPSAISALPATQKDGRCHQVPRLPRKATVDVTKCHASHAKRRSMSPSAMPAKQTAAATTCAKRDPSASLEPGQCHECQACPATQSDGRRLPRKAKVNVTKCHACRAKGRGDHSAKRDPSASPGPAQYHKRNACHAK